MSTYHGIRLSLLEVFKFKKMFLMLLYSIFAKRFICSLPMVQAVCYRSNCGINYTHFNTIADFVKQTRKTT